MYSWNFHKTLYTLEPRGKSTDLIKSLDQTHLLVSEGLLYRQGAAVAQGRDKGTVAIVLEGSLCHELS